VYASSEVRRQAPLLRDRCAARSLRPIRTQQKSVYTWPENLSLRVSLWNMVSELSELISMPQAGEVSATLQSWAEGGMLATVAVANMAVAGIQQRLLEAASECDDDDECAPASPAAMAVEAEAEAPPAADASLAEAPEAPVVAEASVVTAAIAAAVMLPAAAPAKRRKPLLLRLLLAGAFAAGAAAAALQARKQLDAKRAAPKPAATELPAEPSAATA